MDYLWVIIFACGALSTFGLWIPTFFELKQLRKDNTLLWMEHYIVDDLLAVGLHETIRRDLLAAHREVKEKAGGPNGRA